MLDWSCWALGSHCRQWTMNWSLLFFSRTDSLSDEEEPVRSEEKLTSVCNGCDGMSLIDKIRMCIQVQRKTLVRRTVLWECRWFSASSYNSANCLLMCLFFGTVGRCCRRRSWVLLDRAKQRRKLRACDGVLLVLGGCSIPLASYALARIPDEIIRILVTICFCITSDYVDCDFGSIFKRVWRQV